MTTSYPFEVVVPDWPAPRNIVAFTTCRRGGFSEPPYDELNLGLHVGDASEKVNSNRARLLSACDGLHAIQWLNQLHSTAIYPADGKKIADADASITGRAGLACAVMTADCLPLLVCDKQGLQVAAIHAGWRGLLNGIIENAIGRFNEVPGQLLAWLGPAIGSAAFEVGPEVREQFLAAADAATIGAVEAAFTPSPHKPRYYLADLYALARARLSALGLLEHYGGNYCCYKDSGRFYSYRRDGVTGRMASLIYIKP